MTTNPNGFWVTVTGDDITLLDTETTIMSSVTPLQDLDTCVANAIQVARGYVSGGANPMEVSPYIPPECVNDVIAIARATYLAQEPSGTLLTKVRQTERDNAIAHLRDIAKEVSSVSGAKLDISAPDILKYGQWGSVQRLAMRTDPTTVPPTTPPSPT
jgi:hypothetical protein